MANNPTLDKAWVCPQHGWQRVVACGDNGPECLEDINEHEDEAGHYIRLCGRVCDQLPKEVRSDK